MVFTMGIGMIKERRSGFTIIEILLVITLLSVLFMAIPGFEKNSLFRIVKEDEVQYMVDLLRMAQRRAILSGERQYLTLDLVTNEYRIYTLKDNDEKVLKSVELKKLDLVGINRSVTEMEQTFYYTPQGSSVFGCTISLKDQSNLWKVVIAVGSGKIKIEKE